MKSPSSPTWAVIDRARSIRFQDLPEDVVIVARHCLRDWVAVAVAGSREPVACYLRDEVVDRGGNAQASVFGLDGRVNAHDAALCNGVAAHALDYDDVLETMLGHPTAPVLSAVFAVGEKVEARGRDVLAAFVAGVEVESLIGRMLEPGHHEAGWHTTGTLGTFGATAAVAHLLRLEREQWGHAFGLAAAQAAGVKASFGTMAKPFHAGRAAANGVLAASLAQRGVTGASEVIEAPRGFAELTTATVDFGVVDTRASSDYDIREVLFKWHASCYLTHSLIEGLSQIRDELPMGTADITSIRLRVMPVHMSTCGLETFRTDLEAKFCMSFLAGLALVVGKANEEHFTEDWRNDPEIVRLSRLVRFDVETSGRQMATLVEVQTADSGDYTACIDVGRSAQGSELAIQERKLTEKFHTLVDPILGPERSAALSSRIDAFEDIVDVNSMLVANEVTRDPVDESAALSEIVRPHPRPAVSERY